MPLRNGNACVYGSHINLEYTKKSIRKTPEVMTVMPIANQIKNMSKKP